MISHPLVSTSQMARADALLLRGIEDELYTHAVSGLMRGGSVVAVQAFGAANADTVFDLASLTKPLATATLLLQCAERGLLHLRQSPGRAFGEEFGALPHLTDVQLKHLLTHTSGLPPVPRWPAPNSSPARKDCLDALLSTPLLRPPGAGYTYSDAGYLLLGEIISRLCGSGLEALFQTQIAQPLELRDTGFCPAATLWPRLAPTGSDLPAGTVHDPRARDLGGVAGHAGLFGTARDMLAFAEAIRTGGGPVLSHASVQRMSHSQISPALGGQSYGWFCAGNDFLPQGDFFSDNAFGHSGFTGTMLLIDPAFDISLTLLTNRTVNTREDGSRFLRLRRLWLNTIAAALL